MQQLRKKQIKKHFNSLPHTEVDSGLLGLYIMLHISTHYLTQRQTPVLNSKRTGVNISTHYLTQRQTARNVSCLGIARISTHYLTQRQTEAYEHEYLGVPFQLTTSHRGRRITDFIQNDISISTHYLTQRQTDDGKVFSSVFGISTHYLTQRQTSQEDS